MNIERYRRNPAAFVDDYIPRNEKGQGWKLSAHQRNVLALAFEDGRADLLRLLLWGEMKKSGKTLLAAALGLWWAYTRPYTEVIVAANDLEQSVGRVFKTMTDLIKHNPALKQSARPKAQSIDLTNGTVVLAIASDYKGAAGSRHSLVIFDELWGYSTENARRLVEELTPPPTEPEAWVLVVTYAGYAGESVVLEAMYDRGIAGERLDDDLEVFWAQGQLTFWSHTPRQRWQTAEYYEEQRRSLRPNAYARLHENRWVAGESPFITKELYDACVVPGLTSTLAGARIQVGIDIGIKNDNGAVVAVTRHGSQLRLVAHRFWRPTKKEPLDIEATVEAFILELRERHTVSHCLYDPYQFHRSATTLKQRGLRMEEYPQNPANLTRMGQNLFELFQGRNLQLYDAPDLRTHCLNAVAVESTRGWRLAKEKSSKKIDGAIALAMACVATLDHGFKSAAVATIQGRDPDDMVGMPGAQHRAGSFFGRRRAWAAELERCGEADEARRASGTQDEYLKHQSRRGNPADFIW